MIPIEIYLIVKLLSFLSWVFGKDDAPGCVNYSAGPVAVDACTNGFFDIAALGSDARNKKRHIFYYTSHNLEFPGVGGADDKCAVIVCIPVFCHMLRNFLIQVILKFTCSRITCPAQDNTPLLFSVQKRFQCFAA